MKLSTAAALCALCVSSTQGFSEQNAAFVTRTSLSSRVALSAAPRYGPPAETGDEDEAFRNFIHGGGCPCCLTHIMLSPREARVEGPMKALAAGGVMASLSPAAPAQASGKTFSVALNQYFPLSLTSSQMIDSVVTTLSGRQFNKANTIFGSSVCPDEINSKPGKSLAAVLQSSLTDQNGQFTLGGLGGIPFVGISGMKAFLSHTPDKGRVVIMYGPHVGISDDGVVGKVERLGRAGLSGSCGAGLGALKVIQGEIQKEIDEKEAKAKAEADAKAAAAAAAPAPAPAPAKPPASIPVPSVPDAAKAGAAGAILKAPLLTPKVANAAEIPDGAELPSVTVAAAAAATATPAPAAAAPAAPRRQSVMDNQEDYIIRKLRPRLTTPTAKSVSKAAAPAFVTNEMFGLVEELLMEELKAFWKDPGSWDSIQEVVLLGGIVINRGQYATSIDTREDYYHPMVFESYQKPATPGTFPTPVDLYTETFGARADSWFD